MKPSGIAADLMPDQAAGAAMLDTNIARPMHYGTFHNPPFYAECSDAERAFLTAAERLGVNARIIQPGSEAPIS